jgi:hypothetical protein
MCTTTTKNNEQKAANNDDPRRLFSSKWLGAAISVPGLGCLIGGINDSKTASTIMLVKNRQDSDTPIWFKQIPKSWKSEKP